MAQTSRLRRQLRSAFAIAEPEPAWSTGARLALMTAVPIVVGFAVDRPDVAILATLGALNTGLADPGGPYGARLGATVAAALTMTFALTMSTVFADSLVLSALTLALFAFAAGLIGAQGSIAAGVSFVAVVLFIIGLGMPVHDGDIAPRAGWFLLGCAWAIVVVTALWPLRPDLPMRRALADLYAHLATFLRSVPHDARDRERQRDEIDRLVGAAQNAAVRFRRGRRGRSSVASTALGRLHGAETVALGLGALDLACAEAGTLPRETAAALDALADACEQLAEAARTDRPPDLTRLEDAVHRQPGATGEAHAVVADALRFMAAGIEQPERAMPSRSPMDAGPSTALLRLGSLFHPDSMVLRHSLRLAAVIAVAQVMAFIDPFTNGYWIPLTVLIVLKPDLGSTLDRGLQRIGGTLVGLIPAFGLVELFGDREWVLIVLFILLMTLIGALVEINYSMAVVGITPAVILLLALDGGGPELTWVRVGGTLVGGALALLGGLVLWPLWERTRLRSTLSAAALTEATYLGEVIASTVPIGQVRAAHRAADRARSNAEASLQRMLSEPRSRWVAPAAVVEFCAHDRALVELTTALRVQARAGREAGGELAELPDDLRRVSAILNGSAAVEEPPASMAESRPVSLAAQLTSDVRGLHAAAVVIARELDRGEPDIERG